MVKDDYLDNLKDRIESYYLPVYWKEVPDGSKVTLQVNTIKDFGKKVENSNEVRVVKGKLLNDVADLRSPQNVEVYFFPKAFDKALIRGIRNAFLSYETLHNPFIITFERVNLMNLKITLAPGISLESLEELS
jgi:hypothetical protein